MPDGNTSPDATPDKDQFKGYVYHDEREMTEYAKLSPDELKERFKDHIRERLKQGPLQNVSFRYPKNEEIAKKYSQLMQVALEEVKYEQLTEEWSKDPSNVIAVEDHVSNSATGEDPVSLFSGNFVYSNNDIALAGAGMDFIFTRTHSNQSTFRGPLGEKWDHNYNLRLRVMPDNNTIYRSTGTGSETLYRRHNVHNYWLAEKGEDGIITQSGNDFTWRSSDGIELRYARQINTSGNIFVIKEIKDRFGNYLDFGYNAENGLLEIVLVNNSERFVRFDYDNGKIIHINDFYGRRWDFTYDDFDDLIAVTSPAPEKSSRGPVTRYEYSTAAMSDKQLQHNIIAIIDANGQIYLENEYGMDPNLVSYNRVIRQRQGGGESLFDYQDVIEDFDSYYESNQRPTFQTIVTGRDGHAVRYILNRYGNILFKEEYTKVNGIPKIISSHFRYNRDGNILGTITPEGVVTQFLYGRDYYERKRIIEEDYLDIEDAYLDAETRQNFNRLLASVKRGKYYSITALNIANGLWKDIFPDIYETSEDDVIHKFTFEQTYGQPLTISDPRYTQNSNPDFIEPPDYDLHLTRYSYKPSESGSSSQFHFLDKVELPSTTSPDGLDLGRSVFEMKSYDDHGRLSESVGPEGLVTLISYSSSGLMEGFIKEIELDPTELSIKTAFDRDELGRVINTYLPKSFDNTDKKFIIVTKYNDLNQVIGITGTKPFEFKVRRQYDRVGNIKQESFERKQANGTSYEEPLEIKTNDYDEEFHVIKTTIGGSKYTDHKKYRNVYDISGRLFLTISPGGRKSKLRYNELSLVSKKVNDHGGVFAATKMLYDGDGRLIREIDASGAEKKFFYDALGRIIELQDSLGNKRIFTYDKLGKVITVRFFERSQERYRLLSRSEYIYDEVGRVSRASVNLFKINIEVSQDDVSNAFVNNGPGDLLTTLYFYDKNGQILKTVGPSGRENHMEYDKIGRVVKKTDPYGNETKFLYDKHGNLIRSDNIEIIRDPTSNQIIGRNYFATTFTYDDLDRLTQQTDGMGNQLYYEYDSLNQITKVIDPLENTIEKEYDIFRRSIQMSRRLEPDPATTSPLLINTKYTYDLDDTLIEQIDPLGRVTKFRHDSMGRLISTVLPDQSQDICTYDKSNKPTKYRDNNGVLFNYGYDILGRLISTNVDNSNLLTDVDIDGSTFKNYGYDALGRITFMENEFCKYTLSYNSLGLLIEEKNVYLAPDNPNKQTHIVIKRDYDINGALSTIVYPTGRKIRYKRDVLDRITSIEQETRGLPYPGDSDIPENIVIMNVEYNGLRRKKIKRYNQTSTEFYYDRGARMIEIKHHYKDGLLLHLQYLYDGIGNIRQKNEESSEATRTTTFQYDSNYRISDISRLEVNSVSNLEPLYPFTHPVPDVIPYSQADMNALIKVSLPVRRKYSYDLVGNRLTKEDRNHIEEYVMDNNLDQYSTVDDNIMKYDKMGNLIEDNKWKYRYNSSNQVSSIQPKDENNQHYIKFYHDPIGRKTLEIRNDLSKLFISDAWNVIEEYKDDDIQSSLVSDEGIDNIIEISANHANFWIYPDIIKSIVYIMKGKEKDKHYDYDEFGKIITTGDDATILNRFTGKRIISESQKHDFGFRTYDPAIGRFLQRDPQGYLEGTNLYTYALNNPTSRIDPFGTDSRQDRDRFSDIKSLPLYKWLKNFDEKGKMAAVPIVRFTPIEEFVDKFAQDYRKSPPLNAWWASLSDEELEQYHKEFPLAKEEFYDYAKLKYKEYMSEKESRLLEGFRRMDTAAGVVNIIAGTTIGISFGFLAPTASAIVGSYDAGVTIKEMATGKTSGVHTVNLLTGSIGEQRPMTTGEYVAGGIYLGVFVLGMAVGPRLGRGGPGTGEAPGGGAGVGEAPGGGPTGGQAGSLMGTELETVEILVKSGVPRQYAEQLILEQRLVSRELPSQWSGRPIGTTPEGRVIK